MGRGVGRGVGRGWSRGRGLWRLRALLIPELDRPVRTARDEDVLMEGVPADGVDCHRVRIVRFEVACGKGRGGGDEVRQNRTTAHACLYQRGRGC